MQYLIVLILGALANRMRGGGVLPSYGDFFGTQKRRLSYCFVAFLIFVLARAEKIGLSPEGLPFYDISSDVLYRGLAIFLILFAVHLTGWGRAIGAAGGWEDKPLAEFKPLDYLTNALLFRIDKMPMWNITPDGTYQYYPKRRLRLWGFVWLTYWGLITGALIGIAADSFAPLFSFGCMGVVYCAVFIAYEKLGKKVGLGWATSEYVFGAISFLGLVLC